MKLSFVQLVSLLPFLHLAFADISADEASKIAYRAYGDFVVQGLTAGVPLKQGSDYVYVLPPTSAGVRAGTVVPEAVTNWDLLSLANTMQTPNEPLYQTTGASYIQDLKTYLHGVASDTSEISTKDMQKLGRLADAASAAFDKFLTEQDKAIELYEKDQLTGRKTTFAKFTVAKYPRFISRKKEWKSAEALLANFRRQVTRTDDALNDRINKIDELALDEKDKQSGYNMPVYVGGDFITNLTRPWVQKEIAEPDLYQPFYGTSGLEEAANNWFANTSPSTIVSLSLKKSGSSDWSALGHSTSVIQGSAGYFGFIGAKAGSSSTSTTFNSYGTTFSDDVDITFSFRGPPATFSLRAGLWDVADARAAYPKLLPNATDSLVGKVRPQKVLLAYQPGLTIAFKNANTWKNVKQFIDTAKSNKGGGISIFGFSFGGSGGRKSDRTMNDIQTQDSGTGGSIIIPPAAPGALYVLGVLGRKL
ncbi:hypothetical protein EJ08DRAFT_653994 [Tothia fuscella]|uniref:Uncharacterized protein n=1 Tax=Tothia fuscella TaxID=1048955 RepID=A0A9P4NFU2_9PEZI|nr:hypothetical protein EJ08DRAFT_653994 [Tothia fuscella]